MQKKLLSIFGVVIVLAMVLAACEPAVTPAPETIIQEVEVIREVEVEVPVEVVVEVPVVPEVEPSTRTGAWLDTIVVLEEIDYNKAFERLDAGELGLYMFSTSDPEFKAKVDASPNVQSEVSFGSNREITFNPAGPLFENGVLNPFSVPRIREAMNWLIDREYIAEELYSGTVNPRTTVISTSSPDYGILSAVTRRIENEYAYNKDLAAEIIGEEMLALGAELVNGIWSYEGEPVEIIFIIRQEWGMPQGDYLANQLEDIGFQVFRDYKTAAEAGPVWLTGDPTQGLWHLYTGGWGATGLSRDVSWTAGYFHTNFGRGETLWQAYDPDPEFFDVAEKLWNAEWSSVEERAEWFEAALIGAMEDSVRIWLFDEKGFTAFRSDVSVGVDLAAGVVGSALWPYTLRYDDREGGSMTVAMPSILTQPMNPPDGSNWTYDQAISRATGDAAFFLDPYTGLAYPQRMETMEIFVVEGSPVDVTLDWLTLEFVPEITVPEDAWADWDAAEQRFLTVGELYPDGLQSASRRVVYYPDDLYDTVLWHDGSAFSIADVLYGMILTFDRAKEDSPVFDESKIPAFSTFMGTFKGVRILSEDPLVIETYIDATELDAELMLSTWWPYYGHGAGSWHVLSLGFLAEEKLLATYTDAKANANNVDRFNFVAGETVGILKAELDEVLAAEEVYIPYAGFLGQYLSEEEAAERYANVLDWYNTRGHFWVGNGVYYLEKAFPTEKMVVLQRFAGFPDMADKWALFSEPALAEVFVDGPLQFAQGEEAVFEVEVTFKGEPYAIDDVSSVSFLFFDATGTLALQGDAVAVQDGLWEVVLTAEQTADLETGAGTLEVVVLSKLAVIPSFDQINVVVAAQ